MAKQYTREELWKLYEKLPRELKEAVFAEETANHIDEICKRYEIPEGKVPEIAKQVGNVLLGILPPNEFQDILEKDLKLEKDIAKNIAREVERFIFYPVRPSLEELYKKEMVPVAKPAGITPSPQEKPSKTAKADIYRESVE